MAKSRVLIVGLEPSLIDFSDPAYARGRNAAAVRAGLEVDEAQLKALGYDAELCLIDFGETAETVLRQRLGQTSFDCILTEPTDTAEAIQRWVPPSRPT
jgi:hypothetical protein